MDEKIRELEERLAALISAVQQYCDNPGCNVQTKRTAVEKLRWSLEQAKA